MNPAVCPHFEGEVLGPRLPDPLTFVATYCPRCQLWVRGAKRAVEATGLRRAGFSPMPLRCRHCHQRLRLSQRISLRMIYGSALQCRGCDAIHYVIWVPSVRLAFVVDVSSHEVVEMAAKGMTTLEVLRELNVLREDLR